MNWLIAAASGLAVLLVGGFVIGQSSVDSAHESKVDECAWMLTTIYIEGSEMVNGTGTLRWIEAEGGFWGIEADDGTRYQPTGICDELAEDGLRIGFEGRTRPDMAGIHMWGTYLDLTLLKRA